jgi:hypothetical protein
MKKRARKDYNLEGEILVNLESYGDIFSDFDPRPYSQRSLSADFLFECKKASLDKKKVKLKFFVPKNRRNSATERAVKNKLKEHFRRHFIEKKSERNKMVSIGFSWFFAGTVIIVLTALFMESQKSFLLDLLITLGHPAGWFFMWEGLDKLLIDSKNKKEDYSFYKKMADANISFWDHKNKFR